MPDLEPITRLEEYLSKLAGSDVPVPEPITRVEKFLAYIAGEADSKPTPITRVEKFLDAIGQGGGGGGGSSTIVVPEQEVTTVLDNNDMYSASLSNVLQIASGYTYDVEYNGTAYSIEAQSLWVGAWILGEAGDAGPVFTTYPFAIVVNDTGDNEYVGVIYTETATTCTVKVTIGGGGGGSPTLITKTINTNGTYDASNDNADGYSQVTVSVPNTYTAGDEGKVVSSGALVSQTAATYTANSVYDTTLIDEVTVNVSGGGGGGLTLLATDEVAVSTSSTTATDVKTLTVPSSAWASNKIVVVKITDKAGARNGYFWGHIGTLAADMPQNTGGEETLTSKIAISKTAAGTWQTNNNATGYGVYFYSLGRDYNTDTVTVNIRVRYNSSFSQTIDGTYEIKVYSVDIDPFA